MHPNKFCDVAAPQPLPLIDNVKSNLHDLSPLTTNSALKQGCMNGPKFARLSTKYSNEAHVQAVAVNR